MKNRPLEHMGAGIGDGEHLEGFGSQTCSP